MGSNAMTHAATFGNMPSQQAILQAVYEGLGLPMDRAGKVETRQFIRVLQDPTARSMLRTLFFSLQECQKGARRPKDVPRFDVKKLGIIGAGLMGQGIAHVSAKVGIDVVLLDRDLASAERGKQKVAQTLERRLAKGRTTPDRVDGILGRIHPSAEYAGFEGLRFRRRGRLRGPRHQGPSDQSLRRAARRRRDFCVEHLGPAHHAISRRRPAAPRISSACTSSRRSSGCRWSRSSWAKRPHNETLAKAWDYILKIKKAGIVVNDSPGFYTSRVFGTFISEGNHLLVEGVKPALIENAAKSAGMPMPPLGISDQVGLGTMHKVAKQAEKDATAAARSMGAFSGAGDHRLADRRPRSMGRTPTPEGRRNAPRPGRVLRLRRVG